MAILERQTTVLLVALVAAVATLAFAAEASGQSEKRPVEEGPAGTPYVSDELIVTYKEHAPPSAVESIGRAVGAEPEEALPDLRARLLEFPAIKNKRARADALKRIKQRLEKNPAVGSVDYNYVRRASYVPDDPKFKRQWGLKKARFPEAWDRVRRGVRVAVVDTGIRRRHPELRKKIVAQWDFVEGDGVAQDEDGHGTHVAGIVAARTGNKKGIAGACPKCRLVVAKVLDGNGSGTDVDIAKGIVWSVKKGAKVVNLSFSGPGESGTLKNAIDFAASRKAVVVAAAGNERTNKPYYPAAYGNVIAVAATTYKDRRARFSNYGEWIDVSAPGVGILSTYPGGYAYYSGTSQASPYVAGLAGLLAAQGRGPYNVRQRILHTAVDLGPEGRDPYFGAGRIDAARAVWRKR